MRGLLFALFLVFPEPARAPEIVQARYEPALDQIVVDIAYRGTHPNHEFYVQWGRCDDA